MSEGCPSRCAEWPNSTCCPEVAKFGLRFDRWRLSVCREVNLWMQPLEALSDAVLKAIGQALQVLGFWTALLGTVEASLDCYSV